MEIKTNFDLFHSEPDEDITARILPLTLLFLDRLPWLLGSLGRGCAHFRMDMPCFRYNPVTEVVPGTPRVPGDL